MVHLPFHLPLELCEIIFKYLNTNDLLRCLIVSKSWCDFIGIYCMRNILIKIDKENVKDILKSERIYARAKLIRLSNDDDDVLIRVLRFLSSNLVDLELEECEGYNEAIELPNLRELTLSNGSLHTLGLFNSKYDKLKVLSLYQMHGSSSHLQQFLKNNGKISELNLYINDSSNIFCDNTLSTEIDLHIKSLFISYKSNSELQASTLKSIENFVKSQGDRLEIISLINAANLLFLRSTWNCMKAVKRLYLFSTDPFFDYCCDESVLQLENKSTLEVLEFHSLAPYPITLGDILPFLDASKNLKSMAVWHLRKDIAEYCEQLQNLESISYVTIDDACKSYLKSKNGTNAKLRFTQYLI